MSTEALGSFTGFMHLPRPPEVADNHPDLRYYTRGAADARPDASEHVELYSLDGTRKPINMTTTNYTAQSGVRMVVTLTAAQALGLARNLIDSAHCVDPNSISDGVAA